MSAPAEEAHGLTLKQVAETLGVPLYRVRVAVEHLGDRVSHQVAEQRGGRGAPKRLYDPKVVTAIQRQLAKEQSRRERASQDAAGWWQRLAQMRLGARKLGRLAAELKTLYTEMRRHPPLISTALSTLPDPRLALDNPIPVLLTPLRSAIWQASWPEARIEASALTAGDALRKLRQEIVRTWEALQGAPERDPERLRVLAAASIELRLEHILVLAEAAGLTPAEFFHLTYPTLPEPLSPSAVRLYQLLRRFQLGGQ